MKNDALIQKVIAEKFKSSTVLTIAHRLSTLKSSDKIMVMQDGKISIILVLHKYCRTKKRGIYSEMMKKNQKEML